ncbi:MAG TPA: hypothetical protein VHI78_10385 [Bacteroidales bacterium]|nr:hypothetical protein [Bacteroidales bacterium]
MDKWKLPPIEKIYEAFSVIADNRFEIKDDGRASVTSSAGDKKYNVTWSEVEKGILKVYSNDNASRWQGYTGYPVIALLMITGRIQYNKVVIEHFKGIEWNSLNKAYKNNYARAVENILDRIGDKVKIEIIRSEVNRIYSQLSELQLFK